MAQFIVSIVVMYAVVGSAAWWSIKKRHTHNLQAALGAGESLS